MAQEWTQSTTVSAGGKIEVFLPLLVAGDQVEVTVRRVRQAEEGHLASQGQTRADVAIALQPALLAEETLRRIWDSPEEDEAWRDL